MLRLSFIGASFAVMATAACAQEEPTITANEGAPIIDAKQVATRDEAKLFAESEFAQADQNADGKVDRDEFIAYATVRAPLPAMTAEADEMAAADATTAEDQFAEMSNGDEEISETELVDTRVAQFDEADQNGDETLDENERVQFAELTTPKAPQNAL